MDRIGQLENIQNDFNDFCRSVKITEQLLLHKNKSKFTLSKTDLYTQELVDMVMEKEKWVINEYGYDFI